MDRSPLRSRRRGAGLLAWLLVCILGCMGCCCGGIPLFGLWPELDPAPVAAALEGQPVVVDHTCLPQVACEAVESVQVDLLPLSYSPFSGELTVLVDVEARCRQPSIDLQVGELVACAGVVGAVYDAVEGGWALRHVTESTAGLESSGQPYTGGGGGDWDD